MVILSESGFPWNEHKVFIHLYCSFWAELILASNLLRMVLSIGFNETPVNSI